MKIIIRLILGLAFITSLSIIIISLFFKEVIGNDSLNPIAASLAVITAVFSSYSSIKIIENENESKRPRIIIEPDVFSIAWLIQVSIKNTGYETAKKISINLDDKYSSIKLFGKIKERNSFSLLPNENLRIFIDSSIEFHEKEVLEYEGYLEYFDLKNKKYRETFLLDFGKYGNSLVYKDTINEAADKLSKLPEIQKDIINEIKKLNRNHDQEMDVINRIIRKNYLRASSSGRSARRKRFR